MFINKEHQLIIFTGVKLLLLSIFGFLVIWFSTINYGLGVSPDSTTYIYEAEQVLEKKPISTPIWPPLFPVTLALLSSILGVSLLETARILNIVLFAMTIFICGVLYRRYLKSSIIYFLGIMSVLLSSPLIPVYLMVWSEPLFIFFATLFLLFLDNYRINKKVLNLLFSAFWLSLSCLTRYIGVSFILVGVIFIVILNRKKTKNMLTDLFSFVLLSAIPITAWLIRNKIVHNSFVGYRSPSTYSYLDNIQAMAETVLSWYAPESMVMSRLFIAILFLFIGLIIGLFHKEIWLILKRPDFSSWQSLFVIFILGYLLFLVANKNSYYQLIDSRYLSPILIPVNLLIISYLGVIVSLFEKRVEIDGSTYILIPIMLILMIVPILRTRSTLISHISHGDGYTSKFWKESETLNSYHDFIVNCDVYSNAEDVIGFYFGEVVKSVPHKRSGTRELGTLEAISDEWSDEVDICLVWFDLNNWRDYLFSPGEFLEIFELEQTRKFNDGALYIFSSKKP